MDNFSIDKIIDYLSGTTEESWCMDVVKTKEGHSCVFGHIFDLGGGRLWDWFEDRYATTYMVYPVNDGTHPTYPQSTPKERCIAYLKDLRDGKQKTTQQCMEEDYKNSILVNPL